MARKKKLLTRSRGVHVEVEGVEDLRKAFARLQFGSIRNAKEVIRESATEVLLEVVERVPVREGTLQDSFDARFHEDGLLATIGSGYFVARLHEFGTVNMPARPYLTPAFEIVRPKYLARLAVALNKAAKRAEVA